TMHQSKDNIVKKTIRRQNSGVRMKKTKMSLRVTAGSVAISASYVVYRISLGNKYLVIKIIEKTVGQGAHSSNIECHPVY
ncbi:unnamed protein product, partial [marine sediment metagenome]